MKDPQTSLYSARILNLTVLVAGLGCFVDTFDFFLFNSMRVSSLTELGLTGDALTSAGIEILNAQIFGAILGSFIWGILGDRIGRKKALLGSIICYSVGMTANAFVHDVTTYALVRLFIGIGVAGEIGLGATLVAETMQTSKRSFALAFFTIMGVLGVSVAAFSIELVSWRTSCLGGGILGLLLLVLRNTVLESKVFEEELAKKAKLGSLGDLFGNKRNLTTFLACVFILVPNYFLTGILLTLSPELARGSGVLGPIKANIALGVYFTASVFGDLMGAWLSDKAKSRKIVAGLFIAGNMLLALFIIQNFALSPAAFYAVCAAFGVFNLWAISGTILVEQFPTSIRATATTASLNLSRGCVIPMNLCLLLLRPSLGLPTAILGIGIVVALLGFLALWRLPESYGRILSD